MLDSVKDGIEQAKRNGIGEMLNGERHSKRSLAALAKGIGEGEDETAAILAAYFPDAVRTTGRVSGKVFYSLGG